MFENYDTVQLASATLVTILLYIEYWLLFEKAGISGWKALIPFYSKFLKCKIAGKEKLFWWDLLLSIATVFSSLALSVASIVAIASISLGGSADGFLFLTLATIAFSVALIIVEGIILVNFAEKFNQPALFGIGMLFIEPILAGILAFNPNIHYEGVDEVFESFLTSEKNFIFDETKNSTSYCEPEGNDDYALNNRALRLQDEAHRICGQISDLDNPYRREADKLRLLAERDVLLIELAAIYDKAFEVKNDYALNLVRSICKRHELNIERDFDKEVATEESVDFNLYVEAESEIREPKDSKVLFSVKEPEDEFIDFVEPVVIVEEKKSGFMVEDVPSFDEVTTELSDIPLEIYDEVEEIFKDIVFETQNLPEEVFAVESPEEKEQPVFINGNILG